MALVFGVLLLGSGLLNLFLFVLFLFGSAASEALDAGGGMLDLQTTVAYGLARASSLPLQNKVVVLDDRRA